MREFFQKIFKVEYLVQPFLLYLQLELEELLMAINKNAHLRYLVIDRCLRNRGRRYTLSDLTEECNLALKNQENGENYSVTERQVRKDIEFLMYNSEIQAPIEKVQIGHKKYYYYEDESYSLSQMPLTQDEVSKMREALNLLTRFRGVPQFGWIEEIVARLESKLFVGNQPQEAIIGFQETIGLESVKYLDVIFDAILNHTPIFVEYTPFGKATIKWLIHPYYLKQYNGRWFLFGQNNDLPTAPLTNLALDRIDSVEVTSKEFIPNTTYNFNEYFDDVIGVSIPSNGKLERIIFRMSPSRVHHVITKPLHLSQKHLRNLGENLFEISVIPNPELFSVLLSFGKDLEVLEPESIRTEMAVRAKALAEL